jgi:D-sedoheptulose 7-phosphate isomerase
MANSFFMNYLNKIITESIDVRKALLSNQELLDQIVRACDTCTEAFRNGNKILLCGNGGSAADAQHISAELTGRFLKDRPALYAEALHVNTSALTAIANDYGYEHIYARQIEAMGRKGDILIGLTTSGKSPNVLRAMESAQQQGMVTIGMTGASVGQLDSCSDILLSMPSSDTARIQELHLLIGHILCGFIEQELFG